MSWAVYQHAKSKWFIFPFSKYCLWLQIIQHVDWLKLIGKYKKYFRPFILASIDLIFNSRVFQYNQTYQTIYWFLLGFPSYLGTSGYTWQTPSKMESQPDPYLDLYLNAKIEMIHQLIYEIYLFTESFNLILEFEML